MGSILQNRVGQAWSRFGEGPAWRVAGSQLGVNYHHLRLDQGLGCTGTAAGRAWGQKQGSPSSAPRPSAGGTAPCRGKQKGHLFCVLPAGRQGQWGLALVSPSSKGTFWLPPKASPAAGLTRGWGMPDTWVVIWMGCVLLFHRGISQEARGSSRAGTSIPCCRNPGR